MGGVIWKGQNPVTPVALCARAGCTNPSWNGASGEFCSKWCRAGAATGSSPPTCSHAGCGKPTWNGKAGGHCSLACRSGGGSGPPPAPRASAPSGGRDGFLCLRPGCGQPSYRGLPGCYCTPACRDADPPICIQMGCGKPTWSGKLDDYCSKACRDTRVCVRPGCGKPTWNGNPNEFCTRRCRLSGPPHQPAAAQPPGADPGGPAAAGPPSRLVEVADPDVLEQFQLLLDLTRKEPPNNWTRDRGCTIHGVGDPACSLGCACSNKVPVPAGYQVVKVELNMNPVLWGDYVKARDDVLQECQATSSGPHYVPVQVETSGFGGLAQAVGAQPLVDGCNEWRLFHGTSRQACEGICASNFAVNLAGTGATWKRPGSGKGQPLYGYGIYLAERVTKADEYAKAEGDDLCSMLLCRVVGGRARIITANHVSLDLLHQDITSGMWDSVIGDRVSTLDKPFREVVIYTNDQVLPEFIITYRRL
mmetsp:Transcript_84422/g.261198  ORF Transcript_84422/g.261198 Transcript_84422/m.261198 type:complete len:476 (+) Transcript_84422:62-1489(+)